MGRDGKQLVSIGSHWPLTGPLPKDMRDKMERTGLCLGCHQEMADDAFWNKVSAPGWIDNDAHRKLMNRALQDYAESQSK